MNTYTLNKTSIGLLKSCVVVPTTTKEESLMAGTLQAHLMQWGYMLSEEAYKAMEYAPKEFIIDFYADAIAFLSESHGGLHKYSPLFPGFPEEVMESSDLRIFGVSMAHYWSRGKFVGKAKDKYTRPIEFEHTVFKTIELVNEEDFKKIFTTLVSVGNSLSPIDFEVINWFAKEYKQEDLIFPNSIPFKENLCALAALGLNVPVNTTTDVLRIAVHMSEGDISLPPVPPKFLKESPRFGKKSTRANPHRENFKFKKFTRAERRLILGFLEKTHCLAEEMVLYRERWLRLGEIIHPGEYSKIFPRASKAFDKLRNKKVKSWYGKLNAAFKVNLKTGIKVLSERPGEFARRLDHLLRKYESPEQQVEILNSFKGIVSSVSNKVLFELLSHFEKRGEKFNRSVMTKGARKKVDLPDLEPFGPTLLALVADTIKESLKIKFSVLPPLGKVYIDPDLSKIGIPKNMRSITPGLRPIIRGMRIPFNLKGNLKTVRAFVHWFNDGTSYCDLDLSGVLFNTRDNRSILIGWNGLSSYANACVYSGDITNRKGACAEYIDFNIEELVSSGLEYAVIDIRDYAYKPKGLQDYTDCVFGIMERSTPQANNLWAPETIQNAYKLNTTSRGTILAGIDLKSREYFMIDVDMESRTALSDIEGIKNIVSAASKDPDFSVKELLEMHAKARGSIVESPEEADTSFKYSEFSVTYEKILEFMGT